jgi:hypothetical protein
VRDNIKILADLNAPAFQITKFDAGRRQLRTAIELWFMNGDPVSIHALSYAAHEIIHRLFRVQGGSDLLFDTTLVKDEYRKEFTKQLKEDANFFKHAERESNLNKTRRFKPAMNLLFIAVCITGIQRMGKPLDDIEDAFLFWLYLHFPGWFYQGVCKHSIPVNALNQMRAMKKDGFLEAFLEVKRQLRASGKLG